VVRGLRAIGAVVLGAVVLAGCSSSTHSSSGHQAAGTSFTPCTGSIGTMLPYGGTSQLDAVQMNWARISLDSFNKAHGTSFSIEPENVDHDPAQAQAAARALAGDAGVVGVVGPTSSVATAAAGPILGAASLSYVSPSATQASLSDGSLRGFYRVVANDSVQGPAIARFVATTLTPHRVLIVSDPEAYSAALTTSITSSLAERHVAASTVTIPLDHPDPATVVSAMTPATDVVVLALLQPRDAQAVADRIVAEGRHPTFVATDSMFDLANFDVPGAYVSSFAPDLDTVAGGDRLVGLYRQIFGSLAPYGGPAYVAMQVVLTAALATCRDGVASRAGVTRAIGQVRLGSTILGQPVAFDAHGDLEGGRFYLYRIEAGDYVPQP
jgi:branched-chain amino acid transport system substrate-binding protein